MLVFQVCDEDVNGVGACKVVADATNCACSAFPSYTVDPYDPQKYQLCFSSTLIIPLTCEDGQIFDGAACVEGPTPVPTTVDTTSTVLTTTPPTVTCEEVSLKMLTTLRSTHSRVLAMRLPNACL